MMPYPCDSEELPSHMPVRRLHNYVYCPRLFYLQWVENIFVGNEDTVIGLALHRQVDEPTKLRENIFLEGGGTIRSVQMSSDTLRLTGIVDIVEYAEDGKRYLLWSI